MITTEPSLNAGLCPLLLNATVHMEVTSSSVRHDAGTSDDFAKHF